MKKFLHKLFLPMIMLVIILSTGLLGGCSCDLNFFATKPKAPTIYIDHNAGQLQWYKVDNYNNYSIYLNNQEIGSTTATEDLITYDISEYLSNKSYMTFTVSARSNSGKVGNMSNSVILDYTPRTNSYTYATSVASSATIDGTIISWTARVSAYKYVVTTYSNTVGLRENLITTTSFDLSSLNTPLHEIVAWNVGYLTSDSDTEINLLSPRISYYNPDNMGTYTENIVVFDGKIYDHYINSKDELNTVMYYQFNERNGEYSVRFDSDYVSQLGVLNSDRRIKNDINDSFDSFYETKYINYVFANKELANASNISTDEYVIAMDFCGVTECNINKDVDTRYTYPTSDTGLEYYKTYDWSTNGKRSLSYDNFASDKYFLTANVATSDELYQAVEGHITPIIASGSRAEDIYEAAKSVLRKIISPNMTTYEKALSIFDWITYNTVYDYSGDYNPNNYVFTQDCSYYLEGVFLKGVAVCDGFSKAYSLLCNMEGIDCIRIAGDAKTASGEGGHAWNKVVIDGNAYLVDITWTEILDADNAGKSEFLAHKYFLISEYTVSSSHIECATRTKFDQYVTPIVSKYNYYDHTTLTYTNGTNNISCDLSVDNSDDLKAVLDYQVYADKEFIEFRINIDYLDSLVAKYNAQTYLEALQKELRAVKFGPQLITQHYDTIGGSLNFIDYSKDGTYMVLVYQTGLLADELQEMKDIINVYRTLAVYNPNMLNHEVYLSIAEELISEQLNLSSAVISNSDFNTLLAEFVQKLGKNGCEYSLEYSGTYEQIYLNSAANPTKIYNCVLTITDTNYTPVAIQSPTIQLAGSLLSWDDVAEASNYLIYCNDELLDTIKAAEESYLINLSNYSLAANTYNIYIIAQTTNTDYINSAASNSVEYTVTIKGTLTAPTISINYGTGEVSWDEVDNADSYAVYINNALFGSYISSTNFNILDYITENNYYSIKVLAHSSGDLYNDSDFSNTIVYDNSASDYSLILDNTVYSSTTLGAQYSINNGIITWDLPNGISNAYMATYCDKAGYSWTQITTSNVSVSDIYSALGLEGNEILAIVIACKVANKYYTSNLIPSYYNPTPYTKYSQVFAFDGILADYYIESQEELNHFVYYSFISRLTEYEIGIDSAFIDKSQYTTAIATAYDSFVETSYYGCTISYSQGYIRMDVSYVGGTECTLDVYEDNNISPNHYSQYNINNAYYTIYDYSTNGKRSNTSNFVSDSKMIKVPVTTTEELYKALEGGYTPVCAVGSRAEAVYNKAKEVINEYISPAMSNYEIALTLFDWITANTVYDYTAGTNSLGSTSPTSVPSFYLEGVFLVDIDQSTNGGIGLAVCDGFSKAYSLLCNMMGVNCYRISGEAKTGNGSGGHAWNKVCVDNNYYLVDITWTEFFLTTSNGKNECLLHEYFLVTDNYVSETHFQHAAHTKYSLYATPATSYNAFNKTIWQGDLSTNTQDLLISTSTELNNLSQIVKQKEYTYIEFLVTKELLASMVPSSASSTTPTSSQRTAITNKFEALNNTVSVLYTGNGEFYEYNSGQYAFHIVLQIEWI